MVFTYYLFCHNLLQDFKIIFMLFFFVNKVQITTQLCRDDGSDDMCVCAVYIRCGRDVFAVDFCSMPFKTNHTQLEEGALKVVEEKPGEAYSVCKFNLNLLLFHALSCRYKQQN